MLSQEAEGEVPDHLKDASRDSEGFGHGKGYLYPHAYRDHWIAQQYLPASLQGKLFFQPSDQGYEKRIREQVARRREAMIEAMEETGESDMLAVFSGKQTSEHRWIRRTADDSRLGEIRDRLLELAEVKPDSLLLDLYGRTGLLALEAARRMPEGAIWVLTHDPNAFETITMVVQKMDELSRPQILLTSFAAFERDLEKATGGAVRFSAVVGRNALTKEIDKPGLVRGICGLLSPAGICALAETVPSEGQRLSAAVAFPSRKSSLVRRFKEAEESLFADPNDPMVNWTPESLAVALEKDNATHVRRQDVTRTVSRRIMPQDIDFWLRKAESGARKSLGDHLRERFDEKEMKEIASLLHAQLDNRDIPWKTVTCYLKIKLTGN